MALLNTIIAGGTALFFLLILLQLVLGRRSTVFLRAAPQATTFPPVSIIVPARNEERNLREALTSLLAQDYPNLEIVVVNDRSTDRTGEILSRLKEEHETLRVVTVTELPAGWLGKNHALAVGAAGAAGDYLLFTDADVVMAPSAVSRAVGHMIRTGIDHVTVGPEVVMPGTLLNLFIAGFMIFFTLYARPWSVRNPRSKSHIGIGAFNMVRRTAYREAGGHAAIAMRPDDDMKLGKLMKKRGFRQELLVGRGMMTVEWYSSVGELVRGLEKNSFAGVEYSWGALCGSTLALLLAFFWPYVALFIVSGIPLLLYGAVIVSLAAVYVHTAHLYGVKLRYWFGLPFATLLFLFILWRSALLTWRTGGIDWRGTHYPLAALKANRI